MPRPSPLACLLSLALLTGCAAGAEDAPGSAAAPTSPAAQSPAPGPSAQSSAAASPAPSGAAPAPSTAAPARPVTPPAVVASPAPGSSAAPTPAGRVVAVAYTGGQVVGTTGREQVRLGEKVVLRIMSEVDEEVHVHGYDLEKPLPAGIPVDLPLTASIPGVFEVELHDSGKVLFQLRVS